jgi:MFS family permease
MNEAGLDKIGFYLLGFLFFMMGIGSLMSTAAINKFGTKLCLVFGGIGNLLYILA